MKSLLYQIYSGDYDATPERDKKQQGLEHKICEEWDKVQRMFGDEFIDRIFSMESERDDWECFQSYQAGFRLGVRLMVEALKPV